MFSERSNSCRIYSRFNLISIYLCTFYYLFRFFPPSRRSRLYWDPVESPFRFEIKRPPLRIHPALDTLRKQGISSSCRCALVIRSLVFFAFPPVCFVFFPHFHLFRKNAFGGRHNSVRSMAVPLSESPPWRRITASPGPVQQTPRVHRAHNSSAPRL